MYRLFNSIDQQLGNSWKNLDRLWKPVLLYGFLSVSAITVYVKLVTGNNTPPNLIQASLAWAPALVLGLIACLTPAILCSEWYNNQPLLCAQHTIPWMLILSVIGMANPILAYLIAFGND